VHRQIVVVFRKLESMRTRARVFNNLVGNTIANESGGLRNGMHLYINQSSFLDGDCIALHACDLRTIL